MAEYSKSHYSLRLKRIIVLAYIQTQWQDNKFKNSKQKYSVCSLLISPNVSTVGCLISMLNLCMKLTVCTKMAALQMNLEYFIKRGDPQQCLLKLPEQDCCSSYKYFEVVPWRQLQFTSNRKVDRTVYEASSGNDAMCLLNIGVQEITIIFKRESDTQTFFERRRFS